VRGVETTVAPLLEEFNRAGQHPTVRLAAAEALITLDARQAAPSLLRQARSGGSDLRELIEPALARWDYRPARAGWLERLRNPETPHRSLVLAIRCLAAVREGRAAGRLRELVVSDELPGPLRLEAAEALALLRSEGLEGDAKRLTADSSPGGLAARLAAATLLRRHHSKEAVRLLQGLTEDAEPAVASPAVARLIEIDPKLVPSPERLLASRDPTLRSLAVEVLRRQPLEGRVRLLGKRLDDPHREVRVRARRALHELAGKEGLRKQVLAEATRVLAAEEWRGLEQAAVLLAQLGHRPAAGRLVELLRSDRPEVFVTAAWGLRKLAVPETLPAALRYVEGKQKELRAGAGQPDPARDLYDHQLSQLNQFLGRQKYRLAAAVLQAFIPRMERPMQALACPESRAAAIWALGLLHEGKPAAGLVSALEGRLNDVPSLPPENPRVRRMCAVTLGRLKARQALPSLRRYCQDQKPSGDAIHNACGWAIARITGEAMRPPGTVREVEPESFFLTPSR
jgi:HEAT repeat protein